MANVTIGRLNVVITGTAKGLASAFNDAHKQSIKFGSGLTRALSPVQDLLSFRGLTRLGAAAGVAMITGEAIKLSAEAEQVALSFEVMLNSAEKASGLVNDLRQFAVKTPFTSRELLTSSKQLLAYGTTAENIIPTLRVLGDVGSSMGAPLEDLVYLFGTLQAQGRAYSRDLYQFANRGIPIYEALAAVMSKREFDPSRAGPGKALDDMIVKLPIAKSEINELAKDGNVLFSDVAKAFQYMAREGGKFGGMMERQAKTLRGRWEAFRDVVEIGLISLGDQLVESFHLKQSLTSLTVGATDMTKWIKENKSDIKEVADYIRAGAEAIWRAMKLIWAIGETIIKTLKVAFPETFAQANNEIKGMKDTLLSTEYTMDNARDSALDFVEALALGGAYCIDVWTGFAKFFDRNIVGAFEAFQLGAWKADLAMGKSWIGRKLGADTSEAEKWLSTHGAEIERKQLNRKIFSDPDSPQSEAAKSARNLWAQVGQDMKDADLGTRTAEVLRRIESNAEYADLKSNRAAVTALSRAYDSEAYVRASAANRENWEKNVNQAYIKGPGGLSMLAGGAAVSRQDLEKWLGDNEEFARVLTQFQKDKPGWLAGHSSEVRTKAMFEKMRADFAAMRASRAKQRAGEDTALGLLGSGMAVSVRLAIDKGELEAFRTTIEAGMMQIDVPLLTPDMVKRAEAIREKVADPLAKFAKDYLDVMQLHERGAFGKMMIPTPGGPRFLNKGGAARDAEIIRAFKELMPPGGRAMLASGLQFGSVEAVSAVNQFMAGALNEPMRILEEALSRHEEYLKRSAEASEKIQKAVEANKGKLPAVILP